MSEHRDRVILHCDMNGFFASVELLSHPELRDRPMAVCGNPDKRHGIILAKNELAKKREWSRRKPCGRPLKNVPICSLCRLT